MPRGSNVTDLQPPDQGAHSDKPPNRLPVGAVVATATANVVMRDGALVNRPGYTQLTSNAVTGRPMGGVYFNFFTGNQTIVGTTLGWYRLKTTVTPYTWDDITGGVPLAGDADSPVRFAVWPTGTQLQLMGVNRYANNPKVYVGSGNYANLGGSPPPAGDITVSTNRVVLCDTLESGDKQVYRVRWSDFNNNASWPTTNFADLSDTPDQMVAVRSLTRTAFAIYKERSQWIGLAQAGLVPFRFELQDLKAGPVSPAAVIAADGRHYYFGTDGSVYVFDGIRTTHIGGPIRTFILDNLNFDQKRRVFGVYLRRDRTIYFCFPSVTSTSCNMAISLDIDSGTFFPHTFSNLLTCGWEGALQSNLTWVPGLNPFLWTTIAATYPTWASMGSASTPIEELGTSTGIIETFGIAATDDSAPIPSKWRMGPLPLGGTAKRDRAQSLENYWSLASSTQNVTSRIGTTDTLAQSPSFPGDLTSTYDISADTLKIQNFDTSSLGVGTAKPEARFLAIDYQISTVTDWAWYGGALRGYDLETGNT
jgi:hypothetical protein